MERRVCRPCLPCFEGARDTRQAAAPWADSGIRRRRYDVGKCRSRQLRRSSCGRRAMTPPIRGEIWFAGLGEPSGHEQAGRRTSIILQTDDLSHLSTVVVIPLTTKLKDASSAGRVLIPAGEGGLEHASVALCHQVRALDRRKLLERIGMLPGEQVSEVELAMA